MIPPAWQRSGWRIVAARFSSTSRKPHLVKTRSPVAIGRWVPRGDLGHDVVVLGLARLLDEHRLVRLQRLDQQLGRRRADGAVEVDARCRRRRRRPVRSSANCSAA